MKEILIIKLLDKLLKNRTQKAKEEIIATTYGYLRNYDSSLIESFVQDCISNNIWSSLDFLDSKVTVSSLFDFLINKNYLPIIKSLMHCKPTLGSPNAKTGDYELMFLVTIPSLTKPTKGDIEHPVYGKKDLKGNSPRVFTNVNGVTLNNIMLKKLNSCNIIPFEYKKVKYCQLMNEKCVEFFNNQFINHDKYVVNDILKCWLVNLFPNTSHSNYYEYIDLYLKNVLVNNQIIWSNWKKCVLKLIFRFSESKNDHFMVVSDLGEIYHMTNEIEIFEQLVDSDKIDMSDNYFRLNQNIKCGLYLKFIL